MKNKSNILRVAVIGPESTGKSALCESLAAHYQTVWVPEYAREFLQKSGGSDTLEDIVTIYTEQYKKEKEMISSANNILFTDTEAIIAKVWCEHVFGNCPEPILKLIHDVPYDYYLLTSPDLPWEPDPLRENPGKGDFFFEWYKKLLEEFRLPYGIVDGRGSDRTMKAIGLISKLF